MAESAIRKYRIDDATYEAAGARAAAEGTDVSKLIRQWLGDYAANVDALAYRPQPTPGDTIDQIVELVEQLRGELGQTRTRSGPAKRVPADDGPGTVDITPTVTIKTPAKRTPPARKANADKAAAAI